jgi:phosphoribosylformylglycinamidine (FGAM) synthase PurS component
LKARAKLWVKLKVTDLVVETAWLTLTEKLEFGDLLYGLAKYSCWFMTCEGKNSEVIINALDRVISLDSTFTNQNKHKYSLVVEGEGASSGEDGKEAVLRRGDLQPEKDFPFRAEAGSAGVYACDCMISELESDKDKSYADRLNGKLDGVSVSEMRAGLVWRMIVRADGKDDAAEKVKKMAVTRSRREGLLLNPHYQEFEIISTVNLSKGSRD